MKIVITTTINMKYVHARRSEFSHLLPVISHMKMKNVIYSKFEQQLTSSEGLNDMKRKNIRNFHPILFSEIFLECTQPYNTVS